VQALIDIQRRAAAHHLTAEETSDATVSFSSMARWKVSRHVPVLPPSTALIVAHTVNGHGEGLLGASYDHRVLGGAEVAAVLRELGKPVFAG
jgi:pyruvate/2-oxoglutarate dehydrogenase complex dihydrolipoamide acyltransferase (E2) component